MDNRIITILVLGLLIISTLPAMNSSTLMQKVDEDKNLAITEDKKSEDINLQLHQSSSKEELISCKENNEWKQDTSVSSAAENNEQQKKPLKRKFQTTKEDNIQMNSTIKYSQPYFDDWENIINQQTVETDKHNDEIDPEKIPLFVTTNTHFQIEVTNPGKCPKESIDLFYRTWNLHNDWSEWKVYKEVNNSPFETYKKGFSLEYEGIHHIEYYAKDCQNNSEPVHNLTCMVDNTPPVTTNAPYPFYIVLDAKDYGGKQTSNILPFENVPKYLPVWLHHIHYRFKTGDNAKWSTWKTGDVNRDILIQPTLRYFFGIPLYVEYYAEDMLGNTETIHHETFTYQNPFFPK